MRRVAAAILCFGALFSGAPAGDSATVQVDLSRMLGNFRPVTNWFGYDEAGYTTMTHGRALLGDLHDAYAVPVYIRAHHLFTSGDGVADFKWSSTNVFTLGKDGKPVYDFKIIDQIFDAYKQADVRPIVELGFMPKDLSRKPEPYRIHFPQGDMLASGAQEPPQDYGMWRDLVKAFTAHLVQRYGREETLQWYWEVWNEPDIPYWHGTREEYFKLYDFAVAGVRAALPAAKVGGPATTSPRSEKAAAFLSAFLKHCAEEKSAADGFPVPLDFISFHAKGQPEVVDGHVRMGLGKELQDVSEGFRIVAASRFAKLPVILSEADPEGCAACSAKMYPANAYRNGPLYAAYTAAAHKAMLDLAARDKINLMAMLSWSFEFENTGYFEGYRSLATNGVAKPVLDFFRMAGLLHGERIASSSSAGITPDAIVKSGVRGAPDIDSLAVKSEHEAAVMIWNYHDDDIAAAATEVKVEFAALPANRALFSEYRIDQTHGNAYAVWKDMGSPQNPTPEQYQRLQASGGLHLLTSPRWIDVVHGKAAVTLSLPRQGVSLLQVRW